MILLISLILFSCSETEPIYYESPISNTTFTFMQDQNTVYFSANFENEYQSEYITESDSFDEKEFWKKLDVIYGPGNLKKIQETKESDGNKDLNNTDVSSWDIIDKQCSPKKDKVTREKKPIPKSNIVTRSRKREKD